MDVAILNDKDLLAQLEQQVFDLDVRVTDLEHKDDYITIYEALYLLNNATLEKDLNSLMERIRELTKKLGRIEITICDTP